MPNNQEEWKEEFDRNWYECNCDDGWDVGQCSIGTDEKSAEFYKNQDVDWWRGINRVDPERVKDKHLPGNAGRHAASRSATLRLPPLF